MVDQAILAAEIEQMKLSVNFVAGGLAGFPVPPSSLGAIELVSVGIDVLMQVSVDNDAWYVSMSSLLFALDNMNKVVTELPLYKDSIMIAKRYGNTNNSFNKWKWAVVEQTNWSKNINVLDQLGKPSILISNESGLHIAWIEDNVTKKVVHGHLDVSTSSDVVTASFSKFTVSDTAHSPKDYAPGIGADSNGSAQIIWQAEDGYVYYDRQTGGVGTWGIDERLPDNAVSNLARPEISIDDSDFPYVMWTEHSQA
jgi:hypothetical protein